MSMTFHENPFCEDNESDSSDVDAYQDKNPSDAYIFVQFDDGDLVTPMNGLDVEPTQIDASSIMGDTNRNLHE